MVLVGKAQNLWWEVQGGQLQAPLQGWARLHFWRIFSGRLQMICRPFKKTLPQADCSPWSKRCGQIASSEVPSPPEVLLCSAQVWGNQLLWGPATVDEKVILTCKEILTLWLVFWLKSGLHAKLFATLFLINTFRLEEVGAGVWVGKPWEQDSFPCS